MQTYALSSTQCLFTPKCRMQVIRYSYTIFIWTHWMRRSDFQNLDLQFGQLSGPLFWVMGILVYFCVNLFEILGIPVKMCLQVTGTLRKLVWEVGSCKYFKSYLFHLGIHYAWRIAGADDKLAINSIWFQSLRMNDALYRISNTHFITNSLSLLQVTTTNYLHACN